MRWPALSRKQEPSRRCKDASLLRSLGLRYRFCLDRRGGFLTGFGELAVGHDGWVFSRVLTFTVSDLLWMLRDDSG